MEGIGDGGADDGCFVCELLFAGDYPEHCPRCQRRMRYRPAQLASAKLSDIEDLVASYRTAGDPASLEALCERLYATWPRSQPALDSAGLTLDDLATAWRTHHPA